MNVNGENIGECIIAFIQTMKAYRFIVQEIPLSEKLILFSEGQSDHSDLPTIRKSDAAFIDIRLMLQRKYFSRNGNVYLPDLLKEGSDKFGLKHEAVSSIQRDLQALNSRPIELISPNGSVIESNYKIAETIIYGHYLHADSEKLGSLLRIPHQAITLFIAPFVICRENILFRAAELFSDCCLEPPMIDDEASGCLRFDSELTEEREIKASPYWKNACGHDATYEEIHQAAQANTLDDNIVIVTAAAFFDELVKPDFNKDALRDYIWEDHWKEWGDFSEAHQFASTFENPGFSSRVLHNGGESYAQVKFFPHVVSPWITNTKQYLLSETCLVLFSKRNNEWKINGLVRSTLNET